MFWGEEIKQIVVKKLFGTLDHTIPLYEDGRSTNGRELLIVTLGPYVIKQ